MRRYLDGWGGLECQSHRLLHRCIVLSQIDKGEKRVLGKKIVNLALITPFGHDAPTICEEGQDSHNLEDGWTLVEMQV